MGKLKLRLMIILRMVMAEPVRTCLGCGKKFVKSKLLRFVLVVNKVVPDTGALVSGRGAYCCRDEKCIKLFVKNKKRVSRAFRRDISDIRIELALIFRSQE